MQTNDHDTGPKNDSESGTTSDFVIRHTAAIKLAAIVMGVLRHSRTGD